MDNVREFTDEDFDNIGEFAGPPDRGEERVPFFKPKDGDNRLRLLPGLDNSPTTVLRKMHYFKNDDGRRLTFACPATDRNGERCPVCEYGWSLWRAGDKDGSKPYIARTLYFGVVIDRSLPIASQTPMIWSISYKVWNESMLPQLNKMKADGENASHPLNGYDFTLTRTRSGASGKGAIAYICVFDRKPTPISKDRSDINRILSKTPAMAEFNLPPADLQDRFKKLKEFAPVEYGLDGYFHAALPAKNELVVTADDAEPWFAPGTNKMLPSGDDEIPF